MTDVTLTEVGVINGTLAFSKGDKGDSYIITEADKQEIKEALSEDISRLKYKLSEEKTQRETADNAINASLESHGTRLNNLEHYTIKVDSEGYIAVEYKG